MTFRRTVASALNSLAAITCEDIVRGLFRKDLSASKGTIYARWISTFFGVLSFALVFVVERLGSVLQVIGVLSPPGLCATGRIPCGFI